MRGGREKKVNSAVLTGVVRRSETLEGNLSLRKRCGRESVKGG